MKSATLFLCVLAVVCLIASPVKLNAQKRASVASKDYVTGKVTTRGSGPARSVWVILYEGSTEKGRSLTGDDGRYYIGNLEKKTYTIVVRRQIAGGNLMSQQVTLPANRIFQIRLP